jgi:hypothetical protein
VEARDGGRGGRGSRLRRGAVVPLVLAAVIALVSTGCGSPRYEYVTDKKAGVFLKVPNGWNHQQLSTPVLLGIDARNVSPEMYAALSQREWVTGIDAARTFDQTRLLAPDGPVPKGFVQVRTLLPEEANAMSTNDLRDLVLSIDDAQAAQAQAIKRDPMGARLAPAFQLLVDESVKRDGGVHGVHLVYQISTATGLVTFDQTSLLDRDQTMLYQLVLACSALCYVEHGSDIDVVQSSFTIKPTD